MSIIKANTIENVAGTETHSVDTMGIENGDDSTGYYTKFPDGTLICRGYAQDTVNLDYEVAYLVPFIGIPVITISAKIPLVDLGVKVAGTYWSNIDNSTHIRIVQTNIGIETNWTAIGKWK